MQQYDAFISYCHRDVDKAIIEALQNKLERLKNQHGKYLSVCRDRTDLSATNDLDAGIKEKLENSRYLIVLCTPGYSESPWCMKELRYFRQIHCNSNENVLPILLEGDPKEVFPEELLWEDRIGVTADGQAFTVRTKTEPLGADIRGNSRWEMLRLLRTEYLRVAAPLLGKSYDDLYRRQRRWQWTLWCSIGGIALLGLTLFALYNRAMLMRIDTEHQTVLANESRRLAVTAEEEIVDGNSNMAMLLALEALPKDLDDPERPIIPEAEAALRSAVYSRLIQGETELLQNIARIDSFSVNLENKCRFNNDFSKLYFVESDTIYVYDAANGMLLLEAPMGLGGNYYFNSSMSHVLVTDSDSFYAASCRYSLYEIDNGQMVYRNTYETSADYSYEVTVVWNPVGDICYLLSVADEREPILLDAVYADGTPAPKCTISSEQLAEWRALKSSTHSFNSYKNADYKNSDGPVTDLGVRYQDVIEEHFYSTDKYAFVSKDECLLIIYNSDNSCRVYSLNDATAAINLEGYCAIDTLNHRLYIAQDTSLYIYSYRTAKNSTGITIDKISNDAQRCMNITDPDGHDILRIWDYNDFSEPLLEFFYDKSSYEEYYLTPDMLYALILSEENTLQLWHAYQGLVVEIPLQEEKPLLPCVSADGSLLAVVCYEQQTVDVYSSDGTRIQQIPIPMEHNINKENFSIVTQLEFEGNKLLISCSDYAMSGYTQIWDIPSGDPPVIIEDNSGSHNMDTQECLLTSDGLLFCVGTVLDDAVDTIYDLKTGEIVFQKTALFRYDEDTKMLIYTPVRLGMMDMVTIHVAYRDKTGMFQDVYTFESKNGSFRLDESAQIMDPDYFLLNNWGLCDIYEAATGEFVMTIRTINEDYAFFISDGTIYFTGYHADTAGKSFPMMDLPELVEMAKSYLVSDIGTRSLTNAERAKFYIS